jgi:hypothetical protein
MESRGSNLGLLPPQAAFQMRPLALEISQRESASTLRCRVSLIAGTATDGFVAVLAMGYGSTWHCQSASLALALARVAWVLIQRGNR